MRDEVRVPVCEKGPHIWGRGPFATLLTNVTPLPPRTNRKIHIDTYNGKLFCDKNNCKAHFFFYSIARVNTK